MNHKQKRIATVAGISGLIVTIVAMIVGASGRISEPAAAIASETEPIVSTTVATVIETYYSEPEAIRQEMTENGSKMTENSEEPTEAFRNMPVIDYTEEDLAWLQKCVQAEQGDFSMRASYLTASCIINRALTRDMTITEVIFEPGAFAVVSNGWIYDAEPSGQTIGACFDALACPEEWCLAFSSGHLHDSWATPIEEIETPWGTVEVFYTYEH